MDLTSVRSEKYESGKTIIQEGSWAFYAYRIKSGKVKLLKEIHGKQVSFGTLKEGDIFGDMAFLGGTKRSASAVADGPVEVEMIARDTFMEALSELPQDLRARLDTIVSDLTGMTEIYAQLLAQLQEVRGIEDRQGDFQSFERMIEKAPAPPYLRAVLRALVERLRGAIEGCTKLAADIEAASKSVESLGTPLTK